MKNLLGLFNKNKQSHSIGKYTESNEDIINGLVKDLKNSISRDSYIFCVGSDITIGDSFGPLVGTLLKEKGYKNVIGTLDDPITAVNFKEKYKLVRDKKNVLAIDAAFGVKMDVGKFFFKKGGLRPGLAVGKSLFAVGDFTLLYIVGEHVNYRENNRLLNNKRLSEIYNRAKLFVTAFEEAFPIDV